MLSGVIRYMPEERALALSWRSECPIEFDTVLERVKELPGRRWVPEGRYWEVSNPAAIKKALELACGYGFRAENLKFAGNGTHYFPFLSFYPPGPLVFLVPRRMCVK